MSTGGRNDLRVPIYLDTSGLSPGQLRSMMQAELRSLQTLERGAFFGQQTAFGPGFQTRGPGGQFGPRVAPTQIEPREVSRELEANIRETEKLTRDQNAALVRANRLERRFETRLARARQNRVIAEEKAADQAMKMTTRQQFMSRQMMGFAGIATAATMPISGFTPLTIGFASMSGPAFGAGAAIAVMGRAVIDASAALNRFQDSLKEMAVSAKAVSERYKEQDARMKGAGIAQGVLAAEQSADRMEKWNAALKENIAMMGVANEAWGQIRMGFQNVIQSLSRTVLGAGPGSPFGRRSSYGLGGALFGMSGGGLLGAILGGKGGAEVFDRAIVSFASRGPAIEEALNNLKEGQTFNAAFVGPEQMFKRIQQAAASRRPDTEKMIEYQIDMLEELKKQTGLAEDEAKNAEDRLDKAGRREKSVFGL